MIKYNLHTKDISDKASIDKIIKQKFLNKLSKFMIDYQEFNPLITIRLEKSTNWGYLGSADLILPENYRIHADSHQKTKLQTLIDLRNKFKSQILEHKQRVHKEPDKNPVNLINTD